jgi:hypothetical protein
MSLHTRRIGHTKIKDRIYHSYLIIEENKDHWFYFYKNNILISLSKNHGEVDSNTAPEYIKEEVKKFMQNNPYNRGI